MLQLAQRAKEHAERFRVLPLYEIGVECPPSFMPLDEHRTVDIVCALCPPPKIK